MEDIMKRSFLTALGIEKDVIDQIMSEHGQTIEALKEKHNEAAEDLRGKLKDAQDAIDASKQNGGGDWKAKYEAEVADHKTTKDGYAAEKQAEKTDALISSALTEAGFRKESFGDLANDKRYDRSIAKFDAKGNLSNAADVVSAIKGIGNWGSHFGTTKTEGAKVGAAFSDQSQQTSGANTGMNAFIRGNRGVT
jgi:hypothetical protein